jgi:hypothetical protein
MLLFVSKCSLCVKSLTRNCSIFIEHANAYKLIYRQAGVRSVKVTHDRTVAIQNMACLTPFKISSFTKHIVDNKLTAAYQAEVDHVACTVQSGFRPGEEWFVPEANIVISDEQFRAWEKHFLPNIEEWRQQIRSRGGDKSNCAKNFLNETIPFLVEVVVQCGVYFILDFPTHEMAQRLLLFPGYEVWAQQKRVECALLASTRVETVMRKTEAATRGSYEQVNQRLDQVVALMSELVQQNKDLRDDISRLRQNNDHHRHHHEPQQPQQPQQQHQQPQQQPQQQQQQPQQQPARAPPRAAPIPLRDADRPRIPIVSRKLPVSLEAIRREWNDNKLSSFIHTPNATTLWRDSDGKNTIYQAWKKRVDIISTIEDRAREHNVSFDDMLQRLETERVAEKKTASMLLKAWREARKKRKRGDDNNGDGDDDNTTDGNTTDGNPPPQAAAAAAPPPPPPQFVAGATWQRAGAAGRDGRRAPTTTTTRRRPTTTTTRRPTATTTRRPPPATTTTTTTRQTTLRQGFRLHRACATAAATIWNGGVDGEWQRRQTAIILETAMAHGITGNPHVPDSWNRIRDNPEMNRRFLENNAWREAELQRVQGLVDRNFQP